MSQERGSLHWKVYVRFLVGVILAAALIFVVAPLFIPRTATYVGGQAGTVPDGFPREAPVPSVSDVVYAQKGFQYVVVHSESGFVPAELTIERGETVRFTHSGTTPIQIAVGGKISEPLGAGMYFEHTFDESGTFEYRNATAGGIGILTVQ